VKRSVWHRDAGRCTFVGAEGRCAETGGLEFHHLVPYARGGATDHANPTLRCRAHNVYDARLLFGEKSWKDRAATTAEATRSGPS
jgi:5-methylcytosine-specific restriction endonuclease McrA